MNLKVLGCLSPYSKGNDNCPGYLIEDDKYKIMLDCGNGCTNNLNMNEDLKNMIIIISHLHNDHYGDLLSMAYTSYVYYNLGIINDYIKVYIPYPKSKGEKLIYDYLLSFKESKLKFILYDENTKIRHGNMNVAFKGANHSITTYYIKVSNKYVKLVYSADTGYSDSLIEFSTSADLLICETTFLKLQVKSTNYHLNTIEAGTIAKKANVKLLLITHFWPEIDKKEYLNETKEVFDLTTVAESNKVIQLGGIYGKR